MIVLDVLFEGTSGPGEKTFACNMILTPASTSLDPVPGLHVGGGGPTILSPQSPNRDLSSGSRVLCNAGQRTTRWIFEGQL